MVFLARLLPLVLPCAGAATGTLGSDTATDEGDPRPEKDGDGGGRGEGDGGGRGEGGERGRAFRVRPRASSGDTVGPTWMIGFAKTGEGDGDGDREERSDLWESGEIGGGERGLRRDVVLVGEMGEMGEGRWVESAYVEDEVARLGWRDAGEE